MNFLLSIAINNNTDPHRYKTIFHLFKWLANTLNEIGHKTLIIAHDELSNLDVGTENIKFFKNFDKTELENLFKNFFHPDYCFIWNGNVDCDIDFINMIKKYNIKPIYGELGFFDHFGKTCYFDKTGVNGKISNLMADVSKTPFSKREYEKVKEKYIKPRIEKGSYIFVPLQTQTDTQIKSFSPFKTMNEFLEYVTNLLQYDTRPILIKQHPLSPIDIKMNEKFKIVDGNIHEYVPYADLVIGINSNVLTETLLYHSRIITVGLGITSRGFKDDNERERYVYNLYKKQMYWHDLKNKVFVEKMLERLKI